MAGRQQFRCSAYAIFIRWFNGLRAKSLALPADPLARQQLLNPPKCNFFWDRGTFPRRQCFPGDGRAEPPFCFPHAPVALDPRSPQAAGHFFSRRRAAVLRKTRLRPDASANAASPTSRRDWSRMV